MEIKGLDAVLSDPSVKVYHMGTTLKKLGEGHESYDKAGHSLVTNGGRVLMVLASAPDLKSAHDKALEAVSRWIAITSSTALTSGIGHLNSLRL